MLQLLGTPWTTVSCVGLINLLNLLPNMDGSKWGRVVGLRSVPWHRRRTGDLVLWREYKGLLIPAHVGIFIGADEGFIMHSGYTGPRKPDWESWASVHIFQLQDPEDRGLVLRGTLI